MGEKFPLLANGSHITHYVILCHLGCGGYGDLYVVQNEESGKELAMKIEYFNSPNKGLVEEIRTLYKLKGNSFFPTLLDDGVGTDFRFYVMELFGPSLSSMKRILPDKHYQLYSVCMLGYHMINCIEELHNFGIVHRDIKPGNFLIRADRKNPLVLIDFGLSKSYLNPSSHQHVDFDDEAGFTGTYRYCSINAHKQYELSRRDDLFSWFYSLMEMLNGSLPWKGSKDKEETQRLKSSLSINQLCAGFPDEFKTVYMIIRSLKFNQKPDYDRIKNLIKKAVNRIPAYSKIYDWEDMPNDKLDRISFIPLEMGEPSLEENVLMNETGCVQNCNVM